MKVFIPVIAASTLLASTVSGWSAEPATGTLEVTITIGEQCKVNPGGNASLDFGKYGSLDRDIDKATVKEGIGSIQVQCTKDIPYTIALDAGKHSIFGDNVNDRHMLLVSTDNPGEEIKYNLFSDEAHTRVWGNTPSSNGNSGDVVSAKATGDVQSHQVFGRVEGRSNLMPGVYKDTVTASVSF